jgi:thymidylate synthase (FAD)
MPRPVEPRVYLLSTPAIDWDEMQRYFKESEYGSEWLDRWLKTPPGEDIEALDEFAARRCYRSFEAGLNANVEKVRTDSDAYFENIKAQKHGSVFEHGQFVFDFEDVSRVFTHELVRHRVGIGISQESMRFVRLTDLPFWIPEWALGDDILMRRCWGVLEVLENHQRFMTYHFGLEKDPEEVVDASPIYAEGGKGMFFKKFVTSFMRRFAPDGVATGMVWSANARILRHVISMRTAMGAEEEIRMVFGTVADKLISEYPLLFGDFHEAPNGHPEATDPNGYHVFGVYTTEHWKV